MRRFVKRHFSVRLHMTLILTAVALIGAGANWLLLTAGVDSMPARHLVAVSAAYAGFFGLVALWLAWFRHRVRPTASSGISRGDVAEASLDLAELAADTGGSAGGSGDLDLGGADDAGAALLVLAVLVVLLVLGGYFIYQAPALLGDAAFEVALAAGLVRPTRRLERSDWTLGLLRATWLPFLVVLALTVGAGIYVQKTCPGAHRVTDALHACE